MSDVADPLTVAKRVLLEVIRRLEYFAQCDFCECGEPDDDGGDKPHSDECPLYGYELTEDVDRLKDWAASTSPAPKQSP